MPCKAKLSRSESYAIAAAPTRDPQAYDLFLRAEHDHRRGENPFKCRIARKRRQLLSAGVGSGSEFRVSHGSSGPQPPLLAPDGYAIKPSGTRRGENNGRSHPFGRTGSLCVAFQSRHRFIISLGWITSPRWPLLGARSNFSRTTRRRAYIADTSFAGGAIGGAP